MFEIVKASLAALQRDKRGITAVEYAVIAGVIVGVVLAAFTAFGTTLENYMTALSL
jgi:Flp pilus assembly pilin Flp